MDKMLVDTMDKVFTFTYSVVKLPCNTLLAVFCKPKYYEENLVMIKHDLENSDMSVNRIISNRYNYPGIASMRFNMFNGYNIQREDAISIIDSQLIRIQPYRHLYNKNQAILVCEVGLWCGFVKYCAKNANSRPAKFMYPLLFFNALMCSIRVGYHLGEIPHIYDPDW